MKRISIFCVCFAICMTLFAQATSLTIDNQTPGWLSSKINYGDQETVGNLKVTGYVNVTDLRFIGSLMQNRNLHGCVDLSEVCVVGDKNNYMGIGSFNSSGTISRLILPTSVEELEHCLVTKSGTSSYKHLQVDTLVFEPENIKFVNASFFSSKITDNTGKALIVGAPNHLIIGGSVDSIPGYRMIGGTKYEKGFWGYKGYKSIQFPPNMRYIGDCAFCGCGIEKTNINDLHQLEYIGEWAFTNKAESGQWSAYQPDTLKLTSVKSFNASAFDYKGGQHIFFGEGIETITTGADLKKDYGFGKDLIFHMKSKTPPAGHYPDNTCTVYVPKGAAAAYNATGWGQATIIEENPLERITITPQKIMLEVEETQQLTPTFTPADADDLTLQWSSDNPSIAKVDNYGVVSAVAPGVTTIYATSVATGVQSSCEVTVIQHATEIQMTTPEVTMTKLGEILQLYVTILPESTTDKSVKWSTTNPSVCTVTASGKIVATGYGEAVVMAITNDGDLPATCVVKVTPEKYKLTYMVDNMVYKTYDVEYTSTITPEAFPTKEGYTFSGWSEIPAKMPAKDVTITGSFTINSYKLIYMVDDREYKSYEIEYSSSITPEAEPTKEGYTFSGWSEIPSTMPAKDVTVTGIFEVNTYTLTYVVDGETYKTVTVNYGDAITPEAQPTKEGYTFSGWSEIPVTMPAKDVTITGNFTLIDAIEDVIADDSTYQIYTIDGKPIEALQKGVNIIKYQNKAREPCGGLFMSLTA